MVTPELRQYVSTQLQQGASPDELKQALLGSGWPADDVAAALAEVPTRAAAPAGAVSATPTVAASVPAETDGPVWPTAEQPKRRRLPKRLGIIAAAAIGILIVGGGAWAYSSGYLAYLSYRIAPQRLTAALMDGLAEVKSVAFSGEINAAQGSSGSMVVAFAGTSDSHDPNVTKSSTTLSISLSQAGMSIGSNLEARSLGQDGYIRLTRLSVPGELFAGVPLDLAEFTDRWVHVSRESLGEIGGPFSAMLDDAAASAGQQQKLMEQLLPILKKSRPIDITEALGSERVDGVATFHFAFAFNREELTKLIVEALPVVAESYGIPTDEFDPDEIQSDLADASLPTGEIWVGKRDHLPHRIKVVLIADGYPFTFTLDLGRYNEAFPVEAPAQSEELKNIIEQLTGPLNPQPIGPDDDVTLDTDADGLTDVEETRDYQTNPNLADTDADGFGDGQEAFGGYSPIGPGRLEGYLSSLSSAKARAFDTQSLATLRQAAALLEQYYGDNATFGGASAVTTWAELDAQLVAFGFPLPTPKNALAPLDAAISAGSNVSTYCVWAPSVATFGSIIRCKVGGVCGTVSAGEALADGCR